MDCKVSRWATTHRREGEIQHPYHLAPASADEDRYGPKASISMSFTFTEWAKRKETQEAWKEIAEKHNLQEKELRDVDRIFGFLDGMLLMSHSLYFK